MTTRPAPAPPVPPRRTSPAARTRARVLEAARREPARGPDRVFAETAEIAGVARRTLHRHVAGRAAATAALIAAGVAPDRAAATVHRLHGPRRLPPPR